MQKNYRYAMQFIIAAVITLFITATASAQGLPNIFKNIGKSVEADPKKEYALTETAGPYLIFVMSFSSATARQDANALVLELRKSFKWEAYIYEKTFVRDASKEFKPKPNPYIKTKFRYQNSSPDTEYAVLIGNFVSMEDKQFDKTLAEVRKCNPASLKNKVSSKVPFAVAFGLINPMLPPDFQQGFVDPFIESINIKRPYTLLRNPRRYTIQIATFNGGHKGYEWKDADKAALDAGKPTYQMSELEKGERMTVALCKALRDRGVEAYEFYDRYGSIVTVGSFNHYGRAMPDGSIEMDPQVLQVMKQYQGKPVNGGRAYEPVYVDGIACDPQPKIIDVPRVRRTP
jgi:hypothetical protein